MRRQLDRGAANPHDDLAPEAPPWPDLRTRRKDGSSPGEIRVVQLSDVPMRAMDWLWKGHLLRGSIEMLSGGVNLGKSQVQMGWIASVTAGRPWPDGTPGPEPGNVILITAEDNLYHTVGPRCRAAKGDPARVTVVEGIRRDERTDMFTLTTDLGELERLIREKNAALVAIDPITAYMGGKVDSHNATDVRSVLSPLKDIAERTNAAFSIITHPPKSASGKRANDLFIGSQAFVAVARIGHLILEEREKDEDGKWVETGRCLLTIAKNNLHRYPPTLAYTIDEVAVGQDDHGEVITAPYVVWDPKPVDGTADQLMKLYDGRGEERNPAVALLRDLLGSPDDCRSVDAASVTRAREARGLSEDQMKRARAKLGVRATKVGQPGTAGQKWVWHYDGCDPKSGELLV
nr:AAA family ATPase [Rhodoplanes elegans]